MKAKKHLGQNFLKSKVIVDRIASYANITEDDTVFEIGPGKGILTEALLKRAKKVIAIEKDSELIPVLKEKFKDEIESRKLFLVEDDVLALEAADYVDGPYKIVANIPYYITGEIIRKFLSIDNQPQAMTLLVQKEVAERICARDKKESILSLSVKAYGSPQINEIVKKTMFAPKPKVDSAVITISNISKDKFKEFKITEESFFQAVKAGFGQKRKQLLGNLKKTGRSELVREYFTQQNIPLTVRAEDITPGSWFEIAKFF